MKFLVILIIVSVIKHSTCYIGCKFDFSTGKPVDGPYSCNLEINETVESIDAFKLKGTHLDSMNDNDIYYVSIQSMHIQQIPTNFFVRFENAKNFACINTTISDLTYESFVNASNLENVWIYDNNITKIEQGFLKDASDSLKMLVLSSNGISKLDKYAIGNMKTLQDLFLDRNSLSLIRNNTFTGLSTLFTLSLKLNMIELLEPNAFSGLSSLISLYMNENKITRVDNNLFKSLKQLKVLSLSFNFISHLDNELFLGLKKLGYLELDNNRLKSISFMEVLKEIEFIDIAYNQVNAIKKFDTYFLPKFQELNATENLCINRKVTNIQNVNQILDECFKNYRVPNCKYHTHSHFGYMCDVLDRFDLKDILPISVTYDDIQYLGIINITQSFSFPMLTQKFPKLAKILIKKSNIKHVLEQDFDCNETRIIDIRLNDLVNLRGEVFRNCKKLQQLVLIKNQIPSLPLYFFRGLDNLKLLDLSFNQLTNEDLFKLNNLMKLTKLHLSGNHFTYITDNLFLYMDNLRVLKLDSNEITQIRPHAFESLNNLKELHLQFNGIEETSFLNDLDSLTYLNLEENIIKKISSDFPKKLQYIDISFNQIESINISVIQDMKNLNDLILINNICINDHISDIKFLSKNITQLLSNESCTIK